ncbi:hypothetical protein POVWA2_001350 [Plasmodium ovale wallikeri]|uniref:Uncharacterized protein n=1 Tax=Plasmodium ovale wallikeri TaxID=864142 RepID=A0A1A8YH74_PLAOA|nr:hypothetical protein POVWA2_001350 [Plasmodium ovale wallikeri]
MCSSHFSSVYGVWCDKVCEKICTCAFTHVLVHCTPPKHPHSAHTKKKMPTIYTKREKNCHGTNASENKLPRTHSAGGKTSEV